MATARGTISVSPLAVTRHRHIGIWEVLTPEAAEAILILGQRCTEQAVAAVPWQARVIRRWAVAESIAVAAHGPIPLRVVDLYLASQCE